MNRFYYVTIGGITTYPGIKAEFEEIFTSKFNFMKWEQEPGGVEFALPTALYDRDGNYTEVIKKQYRNDSWALRIIETFMPYHPPGFSNWPGDTVAIIDNDDYGTALNHIDDECFIMGSRFVIKSVIQGILDGELKTQLTLDRDGEELFNKVATIKNNYVVQNRDIPILITDYPNLIGLPVTVYTGINPDDLSDTSSVRVLFCGKIEEYDRSTDGRVLISAVDEYQGLDIPIPYCSARAGTDYQFRYAFTPWGFFRGPVASLRNFYQYGIDPYFPEFFATAYSVTPATTDDDKNQSGTDDTFKSFKEFYDAYLKATQQFLGLKTIYNEDYGYPDGKYALLRMGFQSSQFVEADVELKSLISTKSAPEVRKTPGLNLMKLKYQGKTYAITNAYGSQPVSNDNGFELELPDTVTLKETTPQDIISGFFQAFGSVYETISIPCDSDVLEAIFQPGTYIDITQENLLWLNSCVEGYPDDPDPIGGRMLITSISEDTLELLHVVKNQIDILPPFFVAKVESYSAGVTQANLLPYDAPGSGEIGRDFELLNNEAGRDLDLVEVEETGYKYYEVGYKLLFKNVSTGGGSVVDITGIIDANPWTDYKATILFNDNVNIPDGIYYVFYPSLISSPPAPQLDWFRLK